MNSVYQFVLMGGMQVVGRCSGEPVDLNLESGIVCYMVEEPRVLMQSGDGSRVAIAPYVVGQEKDTTYPIHLHCIMSHFKAGPTIERKYTEMTGRVQIAHNLPTTPRG